MLSRCIHAEALMRKIVYVESGNVVEESEKEGEW
jgi:hypothetical protein